MTQDNTPEVGTLRQLNVQPGDVVEWISEFPGEHMTVADVSVVDDEMFDGQIRVNLSGYGYGIFGREIFRIISRAAPQSAATPATKWDAMTDAERVTAVYEGLKGTRMGEGMDRVKAVLADLGAIKPEPAVQEVALWIECEDSLGRRKIGTINLIDGKPDLASAVLS